MKIKKYNKIIISLLIVAMVALYGFIPPILTAGAVNSITSAKDLVTDSDPSQVATHTFTFTTVSTTTASGYWDVEFNSDFTGLATSSITCAYGDSNFTEQLFEDSNTVRCLAAAQQTPTSTQIIITGVTNPATTTTYYMDINNYDGSGTLLDRVRVAVAVIDDVWMTARVDSSMTFHIYGTSTAATVGGIPCSNTSTATATPFGTLTVGATSTVCQTLTVETNAGDGFTVTVEQDGELTSDSNDTINSFNNSPDGTGSTTAQAWQSPSNTLDDKWTYGHMGLFSDDADLEDGGAGYNDFDNGGVATWFAGLNSTDPMPVFHHTGPSDGHTFNKGEAHILYQAEIGSLQEAGDYESTLTYICTPIF